VPAKVIQCYLSEERLMESELYKSIFSKGEIRGKAEAYADILIQLLIHSGSASGRRPTWTP
jgi:hypothetical protein